MAIEDENEILISYRLGRLEKQVEEADRNSTARHSDLVMKLEAFGKLEKFAAENRIRIEMLEKSRDRMIGVVSVIGTGVVMVFVQMIFGLFGGK